MDVDDDAYTDLILISAPMYVEDDREGRVYACTLSGLVNVWIILQLFHFNDNRFDSLYALCRMSSFRLTSY